MPLIQMEERWRVFPSTSFETEGSTTRINLSRWADLEATGKVEVAADHDCSAHSLTLLLRRTRAEMWIGERSVWRGGKTGSMFLVGPRREPSRAVFEGGYDQFRVILPYSVVTHCHEVALGSYPVDAFSLAEARVIDDECARNLTQALYIAASGGAVPAAGFIDATGFALAFRLFQLCLGHSSSLSAARPNLMSAGLTRVIDHIDARLGWTQNGEDLAGIAGLTGTKFAQQFRGATGYTLRAYVLRQRIARSKEMLARTRSPIAIIALDLGFSSQGHFAEAFRNLVGETPGRWRSAAQKKQ